MYVVSDVCGVYGKGQKGLDDGIRRVWVIWAWTCSRLLAEAARLTAEYLAACFVALVDRVCECKRDGVNGALVAWSVVQPQEHCQLRERWSG